jgi:hypothetical protein
MMRVQPDTTIRIVTTIAIHPMDSTLVFTEGIRLTFPTTDIIRIMDIGPITVTMADRIMAGATAIMAGIIISAEDTGITGGITITAEVTDITADHMGITDRIRIVRTNGIRGFKSLIPVEAAVDA